MKAILFPGQGSQIVGMGSEFYNNFDNVKDIFKEADEKLNYSISKFQIENEIISSFKHNSTNYFILRIPLVIGPGVKGNLCALMKLLNKGLPLPFDKIPNKRSFISVSNLVNQIFTIVFSLIIYLIFVLQLNILCSHLQVICHR